MKWYHRKGNSHDISGEYRRSPGPPPRGYSFSREISARIQSHNAPFTASLTTTWAIPWRQCKALGPLYIHPMLAYRGCTSPPPPTPAFFSRLARKKKKKKKNCSPPPSSQILGPKKNKKPHFKKNFFFLHRCCGTARVLSVLPAVTLPWKKKHRCCKCQGKEKKTTHTPLESHDQGERKGSEWGNPTPQIYVQLRFFTSSGPTFISSSLQVCPSPPTWPNF